MDIQKFKNNLAQVKELHKQEQFESAFKLVQELLDYSPYSVELLVRSAILIQLIDTEDNSEFPTLEAVPEILKQACLISPRAIEPYLELGYFEYAVNDQSQEALKYFTAAQKNAELGLREGLIGEIKCHIDLENISQAKKVLEEATRIFPNDLDLKLLEDELAILEKRLSTGLLSSHDIQTLAGESIEALSWSPNSQLLAVICFPIQRGAAGIEGNGRIHLMSAENWQITHTLDSNVPLVMADLSWSPQGENLVTLELGKAVLWNSASGKKIRDLPLGDTEAYSIDWDPQNRWLAMGGWKKSFSELALWTLSGEKTLTLSLPTGTMGISWVKFSPSGKYLAAIIEYARTSTQIGHRLVIWKLEGGEPIHDWKLQGTFEKQGASHGWSPDGRSLAVVLSNVDQNPKSLLTIWSLETGLLEREIIYHGVSLSGASWSPTGKGLATSTGSEILLINPEMEKVIQHLYSMYPQESNTKRFTESLAWSNDGHWLVAGSVGGLRVWEYRVEIS